MTSNEVQIEMETEKEIEAIKSGGETEAETGKDDSESAPPEVVEKELGTEMEGIDKSSETTEAETGKEDNGSVSPGDDDLVKTVEVGEVLEVPSDAKAKEGTEVHDGFACREAKRMARNPCKYLLFSLFVSLVLSGLAMTVGDFSVAIDNAGWWSRGTLIANRQTQLMLADGYKEYLFYYGPEAWDDLLTNVQPGWETPENQADSLERRLSVESRASSHLDRAWINTHNHNSHFGILPFEHNRDLGDSIRLESHRRLADLFENSGMNLSSTVFEGCDTSFYTNWTVLESESRLWPVWKTSSSKYDFMDKDIILDICNAEANTLKLLEKNDLCFGCEKGCLPPFSVVLFARLSLENGFDMDCAELADSWAEYKKSFEDEWVVCVEDIKKYYDHSIGQGSIPESCPPSFHPSFVQDDFDTVDWKTYTTSVFATREEDAESLYDIVDGYDRGTDKVEGAYDTQYEDFNLLFTESVLAQDMGLAMGSAVVTVVAMLIHTRSPFLTIIGLVQILLSFPLSYFVYTFIARLDFFPFLNFIAVFVLFAIGADHVFVAVDKWKNARIDYPTATIEDIAAIALPDATAAMFLTTSTTAVAFFGTGICPVSPIKMFAIFCGLLVSIDYLMCIFLVFPALCIYDRSLTSGRKNFCVACHCCHNLEAESTEAEAGMDEDDTSKQSLIRRILLAYYHALHKFRFVVLVLGLGALSVCAWKATTLELPVSADVRILDEDNEYERSYQWRQELLSTFLIKSGGSTAQVGFGLIPADTGNLNDPTEWSQLVLDNSFDPSSEEAQIYLKSFCSDLYDQDFASRPSEDYICPIDAFDSWLGRQSKLEEPADIYKEHCGGATGIPVAKDSFNECIIAWSVSVDELRVLSNEGEVEIILLEFGSRVRYDSPYKILDEEWNLIEDWFIAESKRAPSGVKNAFFCNFDFWWYDTNGQMLSTAYGAAGIALGAAAGVILFSSRSFVLTFFAIITIAYVLTSVTAALVSLGWTLGFLESICFAILIGVSVDFVIHFCYAYAKKPGNVCRSERTKYALIRMGPSVLAAAFTSVAAGTVMLFTIITFFQKFALILLMTILQATLGSFVLFLVLTDSLGPSNPTYLVDRLCGKPEDDMSETENGTERLSRKPSSMYKTEHSAEI